MAEWASDALLWAASLDPAANAPILHQLNASNPQMAGQILMNLRATVGAPSALAVGAGGTQPSQPDAGRPAHECQPWGSQADMRDRSRVRAPRTVARVDTATPAKREMRIELHRLKPIGAVPVAERLEGWHSTGSQHNAATAQVMPGHENKRSHAISSPASFNAHEKVIPENPARSCF